MARLIDIIGNRAEMDAALRQQASHQYDALTTKQRRAAYIHQTRVIHEIAYALQLMRDGHSTFKNDSDLLKHIEALAWAEE